MKIIKLTQTNGNTIYVNTEYIVSFNWINGFTEIHLNHALSSSTTSSIKINESCEWLINLIHKTD